MIVGLLIIIVIFILGAILQSSYYSANISAASKRNKVSFYKYKRSVFVVITIIVLFLGVLVVLDFSSNKRTNYWEIYIGLGFLGTVYIFAIFNLLKSYIKISNDKIEIYNGFWKKEIPTSNLISLKPGPYGMLLLRYKKDNSKRHRTYGMGTTYENAKDLIERIKFFCKENEIKNSTN